MERRCARRSAGGLSSCSADPPARPRAGPRPGIRRSRRRLSGRRCYRRRRPPSRPAVCTPTPWWSWSWWSSAAASGAWWGWRGGGWRGWWSRGAGTGAGSRGWSWWAAGPRACSAQRAWGAAPGRARRASRRAWPRGGPGAGASRAGPGGWWRSSSSWLVRWRRCSRGGCATPPARRQSRSRRLGARAPPPCRGRRRGWASGAFSPRCDRRPGAANASREAAASCGYARAMHLAELKAPEQRVLGCLIEKRWTTPDQYPLSLNALRLACNQSTNRDPVTDYDEATVREAAQRLSRYGLARLASGHGSRATKYRHLAEEALGLGREELAVLAVLLLRGPQTPGELKGRTERMAAIASLAEVEGILSALGQREYVRRIERRPGQKEDRFEHLLGGGAPALDGEAPARAVGAPARGVETPAREVEAPARPGRSRRRRSRRPASSQARRPTTCAA